MKYEVVSDLCGFDVFASESDLYDTLEEAYKEIERRKEYSKTNFTHAVYCNTKVYAVASDGKRKEIEVP